MVHHYGSNKHLVIGVYEIFMSKRMLKTLIVEPKIYTWLDMRLDDFIDEEIDATLDECKYDASQGRRSKATTCDSEEPIEFYK